MGIVIIALSIASVILVTQMVGKGLLSLNQPTYTVGISTNERTVPLQNHMISTVKIPFGDGMGPNYNSEYYLPSNISVPVGASIKWLNYDTSPHTVTSSKFNSGFIWPPGSSQGESTYRHEFSNPGNFYYYCQFHPYMTGLVRVSSNTITGSQSNTREISNISSGQHAISIKEALQQAGQSLENAGRVLQQLGNSLGTSPLGNRTTTITANASNNNNITTTSQTATSNQTSEASSKSTTLSQSPISNISIPHGAAAKTVSKWYEPDPAPVSSASEVTWNNKDIAAHTATADDGSFDTGIIQPGESASAVVKGQGRTPYHCSIHPWMNGIIQFVS